MEVFIFPTTFMMQLDLVPVLLGIGLCAFGQLLSGRMVNNLLERRQREIQPLGKDPTVLEGDGIEELGSQTKPEPDPEPEVQPDKSRYRQHRRLSMIVAAGLIFAAIVIQTVYLNAIVVNGRVKGIADQNCLGGVPALNVKLTRLMVEDNHQTNYVKGAFMGTISVGTPGLPMTVIFDTGSGHLILPSMYCKSEACKVHTRYRRSSSSTGRDINFNGSTVVPGMPRDSITVEFGTGQAQGVIVEDVICFNPTTNASATSELWPKNAGCVSMHFMAATDLSSDPFVDFGFDGIMGLSLGGLSETPEHNFLNVLSKVLDHSHSCASQAFGVFLASNPREESDIAFGGWNNEHLAEQLSWAPVHDPELGHWIVNIKGLRVDNKRLDYCDDGTCKAAVDTGTALLSVPPTAFRELFDMLRHETGLPGHCHGAGPTLHFEFEDFTVSLGPREYSSVRRIRYPQQKADLPRSNVSQRISRNDLRCFPLLMTLDLEPPLGPKLFIMGEPVLRKYYTVYDAHQKRIGFGRAAHSDMHTREELLLSVPEIDPNLEATKRGHHRAIPTLFNIFRWRTLLKRPQRFAPTRTKPIL